MNLGLVESLMESEKYFLIKVAVLLSLAAVPLCINDISNRRLHFNDSL